MRFFIKARARISGCHLGICAAFGLVHGCASPTDEETAPTVAHTVSSLQFEFVPTTLPSVAGNPLATSNAGLGSWPISTGGDNDWWVCRDCTFTGLSNTTPQTSDFQTGSCATGCIEDHIHPLFRSDSPTNRYFPNVSQLDTQLAIYTSDTSSTDRILNLPSGGTGLASLLATKASEAEVYVGSGANWLNDAAAILNSEALQHITDWVNSFGGGVQINAGVTDLTDPQAWLVPYRRLQWRFKAAEYRPTVGNPNVYEPAFYHLYPLALHEARMRGARSYCAMREAALAQSANGKYSHGINSLDPSGKSFLIFTAGNANTTTRIGEPLKTAPTQSTSSNAFLIPLGIGSQMSPLAGALVPTMPEQVTPVVWISGDTEVISSEQPQWIQTAQGLIYTYRSQYLNGQHADAFAGRHENKRLEVSATIPLFGTIKVGVVLQIDSETGKLVKGLSDENNPSSEFSYFGEGRGLAGHAVRSRSNRPDELVATHYRPWWTGARMISSDAPLAQPGPGVLPVAEPYPFGNLQIWENSGFFDLETTWGFVDSGPTDLAWGTRTRLANHDDRSLVVMNRVRQHVELTLSYGLSLGLVDLNFSGTSTATGEARQFTTLREQVSTVDGRNLSPNPLTDALAVLQTNFVVMPEITSRVKSTAADFRVNLHIDLPSPFDNIDVSKSIYKLGINDTSPQHTIMPEKARLRVGQYSDWGNEFEELAPGATFRATYSHLPDPYAPATPLPFTSFPASSGKRNVAQCLSTSPDIPPPPPWLPGEPGDPPPKMCVYGLPGPDISHSPWQMPSNFTCDPSSISNYIDMRLAALRSANAYLAAGNFAAQKTCLTSMLDFLCAGNPKQIQFWGSQGWVVARAFEYRAQPTDPPSPDEQALSNIFDNQCIPAFFVGPTNADKTAQGNFLIESVYPPPHLCSANATLLGEPN